MRGPCHARHQELLLHFGAENQGQKAIEANQKTVAGHILRWHTTYYLDFLNY